jgi:DNA-binding NtrC family response regulator
VKLLNILGIKLENRIKDELSKSFDENDKEIAFTENLETIFDEIKKNKYNSVILNGDIFDYEKFIEIIAKITSINKKIVLIVIGERSNIKFVAGSIKMGAYDYIMKPVNGVKIVKIIEKALKDQKLKAEKVEGKGMFENEEELIGTTEQMVEIYKLVGKMADSNVPVLISGESGTGKELIARAIHNFSEREIKPFIEINCTAISQRQLETELFGYEKTQSSSGSVERKGKIEQANGGTLFLDEISGMDLENQGKLLRVLQENEFYRVGGIEPVELNIRIIASTNKDLAEMIAEGTFREDLYHRLKVVETEVPPLRERKDDIPFLIDYFIKRFNDELKKNIKGVSKPAINQLMKYDWPGNIRELKNAVKSAMAVCRGDSILVEDLPSNVIGAKISKRHGDIQDWVLADWVEGEIEILKSNNQNNYYDDVISRVERELIRQVLEMTNGKKVEAAEVLGITRNTLRAKMNNYGLE